ncbi:MAG: DEAD/DEAH box helicase [Saprospiraceae bacterium]|nr:DEAD/DEAH box helicase [Saprospiraceae bacterium]MCF8249393.1 DEAD/DEAH box helicase [Saprospiraceae bacterium]MCF8279047.1 DEAD/DEAH box helicase [Bacteroidales bacterium]MCF8311522.1 DEAD/DEAH box helicase [Saprospiraceae bacterium]MCF8440012.1 DEAD/DEAH box helicase [Saprospiraceae bacterium]
MKFLDLNLIEPILRALKEEGYDTPTPIQQQSIPHSIEGRDLLACAQTGTGKTAAFAIPILQRLNDKYPNGTGSNHIKTLILTPTRELAIQIGESFDAYGRHLKLRNFVVFGGVGQRPQEDALRRGVDILIATPGRLLDLMNQGFVSLEKLEIFVLDEADRMLDMGFIHDVRRVIKAVPNERQTLFYSATMPDEIAKLAHDILTDPVKVAVTPVSSTVELIDQHIFFVDKNRKKHLLLHLLQNNDVKSALVFTRTKHGANRVAQDLTKADIHAMAIHGNKSQTARQNALQNFKTGDIQVLVATDIAARGIDLDELSHVINFDLPNIPETYVHRIGRTGRAGASGIAFSFCDQEEKAFLRDIERLISKRIPVVNEHPFPLGSGANDKPEGDDRPPRQPRNQPRRGQSQGGRPQRGESQPRREQSQRSEQPRREQPSRNEPRPIAEGEGRPVAGDGQERSQSSRNRGRGGRGRGGRGRGNGPDGENRQTQGENTNQQPRQPRQQQPPRPEKSENAGSEDKPKWSSIFKEPNTGKKGFVIKSDRDEMAKARDAKNRRGGGGPPRSGKGRGR